MWSWESLQQSIFWALKRSCEKTLAHINNGSIWNHCPFFRHSILKTKTSWCNKNFIFSLHLKGILNHSSFKILLPPSDWSNDFRPIFRLIMSIYPCEWMNKIHWSTLYGFHHNELLHEISAISCPFESVSRIFGTRQLEASEWVNKIYEIPGFICLILDIHMRRRRRSRCFLLALLPFDLRENRRILSLGLPLIPTGGWRGPVSLPQNVFAWNPLASFVIAMRQFLPSWYCKTKRIRG